MSKIKSAIDKVNGFIAEFEASDTKKRARKARGAVRNYLKACRISEKDGVSESEKAELDALLEHVVLCLKSAKPE